MTRSLMIVAWLIVMAWPAAAHTGQVPVPPLAGHLVDEAGMLTPGEAATLESTLTSYEAATGGQIVILIVKSTAPETIDQFSIRVAEAWQPGRKGADDGVLITVARDNDAALRRMRIETGRGVQGALTDLQSHRILQEVMAPLFRAQQFHKGLEAGVDAIVTVLHPEIARTRAGAPAPAAIPRPAAAPQEADDDSFPIGKVLLAIFLLHIGLVWSAAFTKGGRARFNNGGWPESYLLLVLLVLVSGDSKESARGSDDKKKREGGGFDGGGSSGNW